MIQINVLIADDDLLFANLLSDFLKHSYEFEIVGTAADGYEVLETLKKKHVDVLLLDLAMPNMDGMATMKQIKIYFQDIKIIVLSSNYEATTIENAIKNGASGYLTKTVERSELSSAIKKVYNGEIFYCKASVESIMLRMLSPDYRKSDSYSIELGLTGREKEILKMIVDGLTSAEIADKLYLSNKTIATHRNNIMRKLNQKNTASLIKYVIREKIV